MPDASAHFVCSPRPDDAAFLEKNNLPHTILNAPRASIMFPFRFVKAIRDARVILDTQQPDIIFSKGSYVSLPLCFAAKRKGIPIVLHESDSVSGYANKIVARWATHICTGFPTLNSQLSTLNSFTGNPLRKGITEGSKEEALRITGFDGTKPILLVIGGSQGSASINEVIQNQLGDLLLRCDIIHITGRGKTCNSQLVTRNSSHYYQTEFAHAELAHFYASADLAISRGSAGVIAELSANQIPSIIVPLRGVGHDHQYKNAQVAAEHGCIHLEQSDLAKALVSTVHSMITDTPNCSSLNKPDAAVQIAKIIAQTLDSYARDQ